MKYLCLFSILIVCLTANGQLQWTPVEDQHIDNAIVVLNRCTPQDLLIRSPTLNAGLRQLFNRQVFHRVPETSWPRFMFAIMRTHEILDAYKEFYHGKKEYAQSLAKLIKIGKTFNKEIWGDQLTDIVFYSKTHYTKSSFIAALPSPVNSEINIDDINGTNSIYSKRNKMISDLLKLLSKLDLYDLNE